MSRELKTNVPITVLMPVRNGERFVGEAVRCIQMQTWQNWELVIVDDGSSDNTGHVLSEHARCDARIRIVTLSTSVGLKGALNAGLDVAKGTLIARQDADDLSVPERLEQQTVAMDDPNLVVCGSDYRVTSLDGVPSGLRNMPCSHTAIRWRLLFDCPFSHTSVVFRRVYPEGTPVRYENHYCEDYDLWSKLLRHGRGRNLQEPLVTRREHPDTYTIREAANQTAERTRIALREIHRVAPATGLTLEDAAKLHGWFFTLPMILGPDDLILCRKVVLLLRQFAKQPMVDRKEVDDIATEWFCRILESTPHYRYRLAWRRGLMGHLFAVRPGLVVKDLCKRLAARRAASDVGMRW